MLCFNKLTGKHNTKKYFKNTFYGTVSLMNENYQVIRLDLPWILLRNCEWFMGEGM